jgi:hypothetical protein
MAIEYFIYSDLDKAELGRRLSIAAQSANGLWESWSAKDDLGPFHEEIMEDYGVHRGFKARVYCRHYKEHSVRARETLLAFFESLPGRKLLLNGDDLVAFHPE